MKKSEDDMFNNWFCFKKKKTLEVLQKGEESNAKFLDTKVKVITDGGNSYAIVYEYTDENNHKRIGISKKLYTQAEAEYFRKNGTIKIKYIGKYSEVIENIDSTKLVPIHNGSESDENENFESEGDAE